MLEVNNITFAYRRGFPVLRDFSFAINEGGVYGLLGRNGAGKSTLLYLISGLLTPTKGNVTFNGEVTRRRLPSTLEDIFIVPEEFTLPPIPLERYVALYAPMYPNFNRDDMMRYLSMFDMPVDINLGALSMGQKKKAFMSFALACNTRLLLMDEPSNGLDIPGKSAFRRVIGSAASDDRIIIISTHQVRDIDRILDHIVVMDNHRVIIDASVNEIVSRLSFRNTTDPMAQRAALYAIPSLEGAVVVEENNGFNETELNLEALFLFALERPDQVEAIIKSPCANKVDIPNIPED